MPEMWDKAGPVPAGAEAGAAGLLDHGALSLHNADERAAVLLRSAADAVVLGSEASPFFHSLSFFFNPPSASHSLTAWKGGVVSGGPCRVPATCVICVGCCRARRQCYHP